MLKASKLTHLQDAGIYERSNYLNDLKALDTVLLVIARIWFLLICLPDFHS